MVVCRRGTHVWRRAPDTQHTAPVHTGMHGRLCTRLWVRRAQWDLSWICNQITKAEQESAATAENA